MKSTFKKFLAMFLAVLFVMGTMAMPAYATESNTDSIALVENRSTTTYLVNQGGVLSGDKTITFTAPKSAEYIVTISVSGGNIVATLQNFFTVVQINSGSTYTKHCNLIAGKTYYLYLNPIYGSNFGYGVLVYEK